MDERRRRFQCVGGLDYDRQVAIVDDDPLRGVLRSRLGLPHNQRHCLADETHALMGERRTMRDLDHRAVSFIEMQDRPRALETGLDHMLCAEHGEHTGASGPGGPSLRYKYCPHSCVESLIPPEVS
jgi:hypothetical protein